MIVLFLFFFLFAVLLATTYVSYWIFIFCCP